MKLFQAFLLTTLSFAAARLHGAKNLGQENSSENIIDENPSKRRNLKFFGANPNTGAPVATCPVTGCSQALANSFCQSQGFAGATTWGADSSGFVYINCHGTMPTPPVEVKCTNQFFGGNPNTGAPVAMCIPAGCTKAQADSFCQSRGFDTSTTWEAAAYPTGSGFRYINCQKCV